MMIQVKPPSFTKKKNLRRLIQLLSKKGIQALLVGGCVRDSLLGKPIDDIDIAVNANPQFIQEYLTSLGVKVIPTGISHGTVTVLLDGKSFEVTSLRIDEKTDGRHAVVSYTNDFEKDAARRDFTINGLYMDLEGHIYDYFSGIEDLKRGLVRYIGNPQTRINEDALRLLRFFRFSAYYGKQWDEPSLKASIANAPLLKNLSLERIRNELCKLLMAPDPMACLDVILKHKILWWLFPINLSLDVLKTFVGYNIPNAQLRLACLCYQSTTQEMVQFSQRLLLSKKQQTRLLHYFKLKHLGEGALCQEAYCLALDTYGSQAFYDWGTITAAIYHNDDLYQQAIGALKHTYRVFPLSGTDVMKVANISAGPQVGILLRTVRKWWVLQSMIPTKGDCISYLKKILRP